MTDWNTIADKIGSATRNPFQLVAHTPIHGGWINQSYHIDGRDGRRFFIKLNSADKAAMFSVEAVALNEIAATQTIRVPNPIANGIAGKQSYLVLEHLDLHSRGDEHLLGTKLAMMHRYSVSQFGFYQDNFIGATPQPNGWKDNWIDFWRERRLGFQLHLAEKYTFGRLLQKMGAKLLDALPGFFESYTPQPSLLHGDLWNGNHGYLADASPVIFDPATYFGDRECDLAMTELFGGYSEKFYAAYRAEYPLDEGYSTRRELYNLYHILNHANLFGGDYSQQAEQMIQGLLGDIG